MVYLIEKIQTMNYKLLRYPLYFFLSILIFVSCNGGMDDVEVPETENEYLVKSTLHKSYTKDQIESIISFAALLYSDMDQELEKVKTEIESGVDVYKIVYNTEFQGEKIQASGLVCMPNEAGSYPVLSYQNGTNTLHSNAPTQDPDNQMFQILELMGSTGFIISLPDYLGFGESDDMFHPYLHKESTVQCVADMLRAVEEMAETNAAVNFNKDVYISGYSQGGWSTMCLQKALETQYSDEFDLKASACGAGPYSIITLNNYITGLTEYPQPYFLAYIFNTSLNLGLTTGIDEVFQQPYANLVPTMFDGTKSGGELNAQLTKVIPDLFTANYLNNWSTADEFQPVIEMLEDNSVFAYKTKIPTLLMHGTADDYVSPIVTDELYNDFMDLGVSSDLVTYRKLVGLNHSDGVLPFGLTSIEWFIELKKASM